MRLHTAGPTVLHIRPVSTGVRHAGHPATAPPSTTTQTGAEFPADATPPMKEQIGLPREL